MFTVKQSSDTGGNCLVAASRIPRGTVILSEKSLTSLSPTADYVANYHELSEVDKGRYNALGGESCLNGDSAVLEEAQRCFKSEEERKAYYIGRVNAFEGGLIFPTGSFFNHSCDNNCNFTLVGTVGTFTSVVDIEEGEELTISYLGVNILSGRTKRRNVLRREKFFTCECARCNTGGEEEVLEELVPCPVCHIRTNEDAVDGVVDVDGGGGGGSKVMLPVDVLEGDDVVYVNACGKSKCDVCGTKLDSSGGGKDYEVPLFTAARRVSDLVELRMNSGGVDGEGQGDDDDVTHKELIFETYELARQTVGAKHYSTILISLLLFEKTVAELNSVILLGNGGVVDEEQVALIIDVFEDVWGFAVGLGLKMGAEGILHKHAINLARIIKSFGDNGSKEYAATYAMKVKDWVLAMLSGDGTYVGVVENLCAPSLNDEGGTKKKVKR